MRTNIVIDDKLTKSDTTTLRILPSLASHTNEMNSGSIEY